ncbi:MAG: ABC transporter ATP-binding protein [Eubacteriales bacterium]
MIQLKNVNYQYQDAKSGVSKLNLHIREGEFVVLCGASGCGKTTVTRLINGLIPHFYKGDLTGEVIVNGKEIKNESLADMSSVSGSMFQNPKSQFFNMDSTGELAFGCENISLERERISENLEHVIHHLSLEHLADRNIFELSGGEKQQIALGSICAPNPNIYILDEPSSNMDAKAIERLKQMLCKLKEEGKTIIVSEHRLYYLMDLANRFLYFKDGRLDKEYTKEEFLKLSNETLFGLGLRHTNLDYVKCDMPNCTCQEHAVDITNMICKRNRKVVLEIKELSLPQNSVVAIIGENGSGKSTFAEVVTGLLKAKGKVYYGNKNLKRKDRVTKSYMVMQDVNRQLFCNTVEKEITLGCENRDNITFLLKKMKLDQFMNRHPLSLSGGQKQRVAICAAINAKRETMIYDEPTSGLDYEGMKNFCELVKQDQNNHLITMIITHDFELIAGCCTHVLHLEDGNVLDFYPMGEESTVKLQAYFC